MFTEPYSEATSVLMVHTVDSRSALFLPKSLDKAMQGHAQDVYWKKKDIVLIQSGAQ